MPLSSAAPETGWLAHRIERKLAAILDADGPKAPVADQKYLDESGDYSVRVGQAIRETSANAARLGPLVSEMMSSIEAGFRDIFPPEKTAAGLKRRA